MAASSSTYDLSRWKAPFFTIWTGQALSLVGSRIAMFALIWWLTDTTGSATVLALATLFAMLPTIVLGPVAGALVDRWNRKRVMILADGIIALLSLGLAVLFWTGQVQVWHVYVVMLARELGGIFHWPAMQSSTTLMVPQEHLARVSGVNQALNGGVSIVGPAIGALLLSVTSIANVLLLDVTTALLAIVPLIFVFIPQPPAAEVEAGQARASLWADLKAGARYVFGWRGLLLLTGMAMLFKIALTPAFSLLPILVTQHFDGAAPELAAMESLSGIGLIVGGLLLGVWGGFKRRILTTLLGVSVIGVALLIVGLLPGNLLPVALALMFLLGAAIALTDGPLFAVLQSTVAPEMQGRVFMLFVSLVTLTSPLGLIIAGPVTDAVGVQVWFIAAGALCLVAGVVGFFVPAIVHVEDDGKALAARLNGAAQPTAVPDVAPVPSVTGD